MVRVCKGAYEGVCVCVGRIGVDARLMDYMSDYFSTGYKGGEHTTIR